MNKTKVSVFFLTLIIFGLGIVFPSQQTQNVNGLTVPVTSSYDVITLDPIFITSSADGVPLVGTLLYPDAPAPADGWPTVVFCTGWHGNRFSYNLGLAPALVEKGYVALTFEYHGHGDSGGCAEFGGVKCVDTSDWIDWLLYTQAYTEVDGNNIGLYGGSYGGGHVYLMASLESRVKTVVGWGGWSDLYGAAYPNDCFKYQTAWFCLTAPEWLPPGRIHTVCPEAIEKMWFQWGDNEYWQTRGVGANIDKINASVFMIHGWRDALLPIDQILWLYQNLESPKKAYLYGGQGDGAHGPSGVYEERADQMTLDWFDYWLKSIPNDIMEDPLVWPPPDTYDTPLYLHSDGMMDSIEPTSTVTASDSFINALGSRINFITEPLETDMQMYGAPTLNLKISADVSPALIIAQLYDVAPDESEFFVDQGYMNCSWITPNEITPLSFSLWNGNYTFAADHRIKLVLSSYEDYFTGTNYESQLDHEWFMVWNNNWTVLPTTFTIYYDSVSSPLSLVLPVQAPGEHIAEGFGGLRIDKRWYFGDADLYITDTSVYLIVDGRWEAWDIIKHKVTNNLEIYKCVNGFNVHIWTKSKKGGTSVLAIGRGAYFCGIGV